MAKALPFSDIDQYLKSSPNASQGCIVDTQFLVASLYQAHTFFDDAEFLFQKLNEYKIPIYANVTTRSEFIDVQRRIRITEALMGMLTPNSKWSLTNDVKRRLGQLKHQIDSRAEKDDLPIFSDRELKELKLTFFPIGQSGKSGWLEICKEYLEGMLEADWERIENDIGIHYLDMKIPEIQKLFTGKLEWPEMCKVAARSCLGSSDAMILNAAKKSIFPFLVSADFDIAFGTVVDNSNLVAFVPDRLYREKIKMHQLWYERSSSKTT